MPSLRNRHPNRSGIAHVAVIVVVVLALAGLVVVSITGTGESRLLKKVVDKSEVADNYFFDDGPTGTFTPTPTPVPKAIVKGSVTGGYYAKSLQGVDVTAVNGVSKKVTKTDSSGNFSFTDLVVGEWTLSFSHAEYTFDGVSIDTKEGENVLSNAVSGRLANPKPTTVTVFMFSDKNRNGGYDSGENGLDAFSTLNYWSQNQWMRERTVDADSSGNVTVSLSKIGKYQLVPAGYTFYTKPGPVEFVVDGYGGSKKYTFPYKPDRVEVGCTIYVFNDKNENGSRDGGEENIHYQYMRVTNTSGSITVPLGSSYNVAVSTDGETLSQIFPGTYKFELIPEDYSWEHYYKITKREETTTLDNATPHKTIYLGAHKLY
jgi:hypothetical protein